MLTNFQYYLSSFRSDPIGFLGYLATYIVVLLLSLVLHECGHAYAAYRCGDPTAKMLGRLTLNPLKHLDPIGTVMMVLFRFGYAKPVPVNPRNFRNYRRDDIIVSLAGITVNLLLFLLSLAVAVSINRYIWTDYVLNANSMEQLINPYTSSVGNSIAFSSSIESDVISCFVVNDSSLIFSNAWLCYLQRFLLMMSCSNLGLAIFNLLPIPPLDGYHVLNDTILKGRLSLNQQTFWIAQAILMMLLFSGAFSELLYTVNKFVYGGVLQFFLMITGAA